MTEAIPPRVFHDKMPYYSQFASPELVGDITSHKIPAREDPNWARSGARSPEEYERWAWNLCGMVCLKSVAEYTGKPARETLVAMAKTCVKYGGYNDTPEGIKGLFYKPFLNYARKEYGIRGSFSTSLSIDEMTSEIADGNFPIASVHPSMRSLDPPPRKGGHLVLLTGYDLKRRGGMFYVHDPAGLYNKSQRHAELPFKTFSRYFAEKGVILEDPRRK